MVAMLARVYVLIFGLISVVVTGPALADDPAPDSKPGASTTPDSDPLAEAKQLTDREDWGNAVEKFRAFLDEHPNDSKATEARFWAGYCLVKMGENDEAEELLRPFESTLAEDTWADDALLHLGRAYQAQEKREEALAAWKRSLEKYPDSVWRTEVNLELIYVLFHEKHDWASCFSYCERVVKDVEDRETTAEARYAGAYCLNALQRFEEAARWEEKWFDPESALEEAWRRLLDIQSELVKGKGESALGAVGSLDADFPDLDNDDRSDLLTRACQMLRFNGQSTRARDLMLTELRRSAVRSEDEVSTFLDELSEIFGQDQRLDYRSALADLSENHETPLMVRVIARDRHADSLREADQPQQAEAALREVLTKETTEFARVRCYLKLAEILADDQEDRKSAIKLLESLLPKLNRHDLSRQVRETLEEYRDTESSN